jgi:F-type H+-transporting ATPase subunit delta
MSLEKLSKRYAKAIFDESLHLGRVEEVQADMQLLYRTIRSSKELKLFLKSPIIKHDKKVNVLEALFGGKISDLTAKVVHLSVDNNREGYLEEIANAFDKMYNKHKNITHVKVITAVEMDAEKEALVRLAILKKIGETELILHPEVDADIIGGFIIDLGDVVYDASIKNKLSNIANELIYN